MAVLKRIFYTWLGFVAIFFFGRLALFATYFDRFADDGANYWLSFLHGLRMDTIMISMFLVLPALLLTLSPKLLQRAVERFLKYYLLVLFGLALFVENSTFPFFAQYDVRPNYLFVEYLVYPREVVGMIVGDYKLELAICFAMIGAFIYLFLRFYRSNQTDVFAIRYWKRALLILPLAALLFLGIRSSLGHRPANITDAMYSSNRVLNEITKNSLHSIYYAIYAHNKYEVDAASLYGNMEIDQALARFKKRLHIVSSDPKSPLRRKTASHFKTARPKNLVIFLQESLGSQFVEALDGEAGITPNLNRLSSEGLLFKNAFSNGTRSIRGIAGCVSGNFSIPGKGVVKRNKSQNGYFTLSSLLEPHGYQTLFLYGGESRFDNMRGWFLGNGFDRVIDEPQFVAPEFTSTWGVSDGDLARRAHEEFKALHASNQKFAAVLFSTSNHTPFEFPDGKIELVDGVPKHSVKNAVKYADHAIGELIELARKEPYYRDTVFVIVADHNVRVYGDDVVPVNMFRIPALILGDDIAPVVYQGLATQPDVLATAIDLMGLDLECPIMGHSVFADDKAQVALMQFNDYYALRQDDRVAVIRPGMEPLTFLFENEHLSPMAHDPELEADALAFVLALDHLYDKGLYK